MPHDQDHDHEQGAAEYWEGRYRDDIRWSGKVNQLLAEEVAGRAPGTALDVGCGTGGDVLWLAAHGWTATGVEISASALALAAQHAADQGVAERTTWVEADAAAGLPPGQYDLVTSSYLHAPPGVPLPRGEVLRAALHQVASGGSLIVVGHAGPPSWTPADHEMHSFPFPTPEDVLADLGMPADGWDVVAARTADLPIKDPDGEPATRPDSVVHLRRRS